MYTEEVEKVLNVPSILTLTSDNIIYKIKASNETTPYIVYKSYDDRLDFEAEGQRKYTRYYIQIDFNSKNISFSKFKKEIIKQAELNNWTREGGTFEDYDFETKLFFCCLRFSFVLKEELLNE